MILEVALTLCESRAKTGRQSYSVKSRDFIALCLWEHRIHIDPLHATSVGLVLRAKLHDPLNTHNLFHISIKSQSQGSDMDRDHNNGENKSLKGNFMGNYNKIIINFS